METGIRVNLIKQCDERHFSNWEYQMELRLEQYQVLKVLESDEPDFEKKKALKSTDSKARNSVLQSLSDKSPGNCKGQINSKGYPDNSSKHLLLIDWNYFSVKISRVL